MQTDLTVSTSAVAVIAPADCSAITIQQKQGSDPPSSAFQLYLVDGVTKSGSQQPGGTNFILNAATGTKFTSGQIVAYVSVPSGSFIFTIFALPVTSISPLPPSPNLRVVTTVITSAQLLAIQTTAIQLAPSVPTGFFIDVWGIAFQFKKNTTAYTLGNADNKLQLEYTGKSVAIVNPAAAGLVDQTVDTIITQEPAVALAAFARSAAEGLGVEVKLAGTTPALTLGDGTVIATLTYAIMPLQ